MRRGWRTVRWDCWQVLRGRVSIGRRPHAPIHRVHGRQRCGPIRRPTATRMAMRPHRLFNRRERGGTRHWGGLRLGGEGRETPLRLSTSARQRAILSCSCCVLSPGDPPAQAACSKLDFNQVLTYDSKAQTSSRPESTAPPPPSTLPRHTLTQDNRTRPPLDLSTSPAPSLPYTPPVPSTSRPPAPGHEHLVLTDSSRERAVSTPSPPRLPVTIPPPALQSPYLPPFPSPGLPLATHNDL